MARRIHIVGRKNSGKTTLVVDLVKELTRRGLRIGTVKHTHHHHEFDAPGKDSYLHRQAGAVVVGLVGPAMAAAFREHSETDRMAAIDKLEPMFSDCDLVLVEGQQQADAVKIEVWREASGQSPLALELSGVVAVVTDDRPVGVTCPIWSRSELSMIADRVLELAR
jgi:molybdopterin-guanine dinucleotide biosynthesis protein MobB